MVEDAVGEVIGGAAEIAADVLADIGADGLAYDPRQRRRRGCWRLFLIVLVLGLIVWGVIMLSG
jgi:hypothetical protein